MVILREAKNGRRRMDKRDLKEKTLETIGEVVFEVLIQVVLFIPRMIIKFVLSIF